MCAAGWRYITDVLHENGKCSVNLSSSSHPLMLEGTGNQRHLLTSLTPSIDRHQQQQVDRSIELFGK
jgi:hypothetical protein